MASADDELLDAPEVPAYASHLPQVSRFEANLLRILRFFLGQVPYSTAMPLIQGTLGRPKCLSAVAVDLARDSLAKGCVLFLTRSGGWRRERFLRDGEARTGRLWERTPPADLGLTFTKQSLDFLCWVTANKPATGRAFWSPSAGTGLTPGDELHLFLAYAHLRADADVLPLLRAAGGPFAALPLCWLAFPDDFATNAPDSVPDFGPWMSGQRALFLEAMQAYLLARWLDIERAKGQIADWDVMRLSGAAQELVLTRFIAAAERHERPDLARFLLGVTGRVLASAEVSPMFWTGSLGGTRAPTRLVDRLSSQRAALSVLRALDLLHQWERRARGVGYYDEGYKAMQLYLSDWEAARGTLLNQRAQRIIAQFDPLRAGGTPPAAPAAT